MFHLKADFDPAGHQPEAIKHLADSLNMGNEHQVLLGVTGSGKTFVMASIIAHLQRPALIISHNKTLAAQLYNEFKGFFPNNSVEYFVSYYDYYQPEAYIPSTGTYIEKDASINDEIDRLRHRATWAIHEQSEFVIVSSVSCIYGLGSPDIYRELQIPVSVGEHLDRDTFLTRLVEVQYERNDYDFSRCRFRVRGDIVEVFPPGADTGVRVEFFGDEVDSIVEFEALTGNRIKDWEMYSFYPAKHFVSTEENRKTALINIEHEMEQSIEAFKKEGKHIEAQRIGERSRYDLEMLSEVGYCPGVENYSRYMDGREAGSAPHTLIDYLPSNAIIFIDESHVTLPQVMGMVKGDKARKDNLVGFGFRLPSAYDNRPLTYSEFHERTGQKVYVSATPSHREMSLARENVTELIVRPTGLIDPPVEVKPATGQVDSLLAEIKKVVANGERVLVTTLTKRMAEDLTSFLDELSIKVRYLHCDIKSTERMDLLRELREGTIDVLIGINLLREGLDLPEVGLVAILDADCEGFLRSAPSIIQTCGRAARNVNGRVILYGDKVTDSMKRAMEECERRRKIQIAYNEEHNITPKTIIKGISQSISFDSPDKKGKRKKDLTEGQNIELLVESMHQAASELRFEDAAKIRDQIADIEAALKESALKKEASSGE
jgi:excinuclease ABC subunit B